MLKCQYLSLITAIWQIFLLYPQLLLESQKTSMKINFSKLIPSMFLPVVIGISSGFLTYDSTANWYVELKHPFLTPPNWLFAPVWTILYLMIGISLYLFWNSRKKINKNPGYITYILGLISNFLWSFFFFGLRSPIYGLIDIILMLSLISLNIYYFQKVSKNSALILVPYLLWVCFATYLNIGILLLN